VSDLSWWFSPHPAWEPGEDWPEVVPVVQYETDGEVALIDPFLPPEGEFDPHASVWAPPRAAWRKIPNPSTTDELPVGIEAIELDGEPQQVVFFIREHATLVSGDVLSGTGGRLHIFVDEADREPLLASLDALGELPIERVIIPHGELILADGAARIRTAVAEARL
jgi:glyoxylase-like metal-dependent hydrolase (beta-lactamase superfamily II)